MPPALKKETTEGDEWDADEEVEEGEDSFPTSPSDGAGDGDGPPTAGNGIVAGQKRQSRGGFSIAPDTNEADAIAKSATQEETASIQNAVKEVAEAEADVAALEAAVAADAAADAGGSAGGSAGGGGGSAGGGSRGVGGGSVGGDGEAGNEADAEGGGDGDGAAGEASTWEDTGTSAGESKTPSPRKKRASRSSSNNNNNNNNNNTASAGAAAGEKKKRKKKRRKKRPRPPQPLTNTASTTAKRPLAPLLHQRSAAEWRPPKRNGKMSKLPRIATVQNQVGDRDNWKARYGRFPDAGRSRYDYRRVSRDIKSHSTAMSTAKSDWETLPIALDFGVSGQRGSSVLKHDFRPLARFNGSIGQWVLRSAGRRKPNLKKLKQRKRGSVMLADEVKAPPRPPARGLTLLTGLRHRDGRRIHGTGLATYGGKGHIKPLPDSLDFGAASHDKGYTPDFNPLDRKGHSTALTSSKLGFASKGKPVILPLDFALDQGRAHEPGKLKQDFRELARSPTNHGFGMHTEDARNVIVPLPDSLDYGAEAHDGGDLRQDFRLMGKDGARTAMNTNAQGSISPLPFSLEYGEATAAPS